jgi:hypothetical protein
VLVKFFEIILWKEPSNNCKSKPKKEEVKGQIEITRSMNKVAQQKNIPQKHTLKS